MTIKERLISLLGFMPGNTHVVEGALLDYGLENGSDAYNPEDEIAGVSIQTTLKLAAISVLNQLLSMPDTTTSMGGITSSSIKYDRDAVIRRIQALELELGITTRPTLMFRSIW